MPSIPQDFIDLVRSSTDIVGVVSQYVPLKASGASFKGLCPFHSEKTPSFHVNPERQIFHCFGCHQGGDAFKFLMLYEKLSFVEAIEQLASRAGLQVPRASGASRREEQERTILLKLHDEAARYFRSQLLESKEGAKALDYLKKRGLNPETLETYGFGWAPDQWSGLVDHLGRKGAKPEHVGRAGLAGPGKTRKGGGGGGGRSINKGHARLLRSYADRVVVNFDPDDAGERAARRSIDLLLEEGFEVRVLRLPDGEDPDSFLLKHGSERYRDLLSKALSLVDFLIAEAGKRYDVSDPRGKAAFLNDVLPVIGKIPNRVERVGYIGPLAEHAGITDQTVLNELRRHVEIQAHRFQLPSAEKSVLRPAERDLIRWLMKSPEESAILEEIEEEDLEGLWTAPILRAMKELVVSGALTAERLLDRLSSEDVRNQLTRILMEPSPLPAPQTPRDCFDKLRQERLQRELKRPQGQTETLNDQQLAERMSLARRIEMLK